MPHLDPKRSVVSKKKQVVFDEELYVEHYNDNLCFNFALQANLDGCSKPWTTNVPALQIAWATILCLTTGFTIYLVAIVIYEYFQYDSSINYMREFGSVAFPAITICNTNFVVRSLNASSADQQSELRQIKAARRIWPPLYGESSISRDFAKVKADHSLDYFLWNLEDELLLCSYHRRPCNISNFTVKRSWLGNCWTFNTPKDESYPNIVPGSGNGLYMIINGNYEILDDVLNFEPDLPINITDIGLRVAVHAFNEPALAESRGIPVGPDQHLYISMKQTTMLELEPPYGKCSRNMNYTTVPENLPHTSAGCANACKNDHLARLCKCQPYFLLSDEAPYTPCNDAGYECIRTSKIEIEANFAKLCPQCSIGCNETGYDTMASYAPIKQRMPDGSLKETKLVVIDAFFSDTTLTIIERDVSMSSGTLFANIGGNMGLLMGVSVISVVEIVEIIVLWLVRRCSSFRRKMAKEPAKGYRNSEAIDDIVHPEHRVSRVSTLVVKYENEIDNQSQNGATQADDVNAGSPPSGSTGNNQQDNNNNSSPLSSSKPEQKDENAVVTVHSIADPDQTAFDDSVYEL